MEKSECETDERATFISNTVYLDNLLHDTSDCTAIIATREPKMPNTEVSMRQMARKTTIFFFYFLRKRCHRNYSGNRENEESWEHFERVYKVCYVWLVLNETMTNTCEIIRFHIRFLWLFFIGYSFRIHPNTLPISMHFDLHHNSQLAKCYVSKCL